MGEHRFTAPGGAPARVSRSASARAVSGVSNAGLMTVVQPAAKAGATLRVIIAAGKFHGVMSTATPTGDRRVSIQLVPPGARRTSPSMRHASSEYQRKNSAA
jgi:hypothetical protein